jgi:ABC-type branched-subunit amino acid transport system ATPase component
VTPAIAVNDLACAYGSVQVLFGVSFEVDAGEMVGLLGTNGAGKSTVLRAIAGLMQPTAGSVVLDGVDVTGSAAQAMAGRGVSYIPGGRAVFGELTVAENLELGHYVCRHDVLAWQQRQDDVLELFPRLRDRLRQRADTMSGGEQQQLGVAKALVAGPRVLLVDELSLGLAPATVQVLLAAIREVNRGGTTVVLVEQSLNIAAAMCDRAVFLEKGAVRFEGRTADLLERDDIARAVFLGGAR